MSRGIYVEGFQPVWVDVRCPWCMALLGARLADRTVSGIGLVKAHTEFCETPPARVLR